MKDYTVHDLEMKTADLESQVNKLQRTIGSLEDAIWKANSRIDDQAKQIEKLRDEVLGFSTLVYGGGGCADLMQQQEGQND